MFNDRILLTKVIIPASQHAIIARAHFAVAEELPRVTTVCAGAGYGKTMLMASWARHARAPTAWLSLDRADNDATRFLLHVIAALQRVFPEIGASISAALQSQQPPSAMAGAHLLNNMIGALAQDFYLTLDDLHLISDASVHSVLAHLIQHQPQQMRLIIGSRSEVPFSLARLRAQGNLRQYRVEDLRFTSSEAHQFMREVMKLDLTLDDVRLLEKRTEGWVAGLQLAALSLKSQQDKSAYIQKFSGNSAHVSEFLMDEVLGMQTAEVEDFLLRTSILERFCPALCDTVTGRSDSDDIIERLEQENLFLIRLDPDSCWYRYHHLFSALLQTRLDKQLPGEKRRLHQRAAKWHGDNQQPSEAIDHALQAQDYIHAADQMQSHGYELSSHGRTNAILQWAKMLPEDVLVTRPALALTCAWSNFFSNDLEGLEHYICKVDIFLSPKNAQSYTDQERVMAGQVALLRSCQKRYQGDSRHAMQLAQDALTYFSEGRVLHGAALGCLAICHLMRGEVAKAIACFSTITAISSESRNLLVPLTAVLGLGRSYLLSGRITAAELVYQQALQQCTERGWENLPVCGMLYIGFGELAYEKNQLALAEQLLTHGVGMTAHGVQYMSDWGTLLLAQTRVALQKESALAPERESALVKYLDTHIVDVQRPAISLLRLWLVQGKIDKLGRWAESRNFDFRQPIDGEYELEYLMFVRWKIAQCRYEDAQAILLLLLPPATSGSRIAVLIEIEIHSLLALAAQGLNDMDAALASLNVALTLAEAEHFVRIFIDEGAAMGTLLQCLMMSGTGSSYARELLDIFRGHAPRAPIAASEPFTQKEDKVIQCMVQGLSNQAIADLMFISLNTVKTHLKNIYRKLGVHNRNEAVEKITICALS